MYVCMSCVSECFVVVLFVGALISCFCLFWIFSKLFCHFMCTHVLLNKGEAIFLDVFALFLFEYPQVCHRVQTRHGMTVVNDD